MNIDEQRAAAMEPSHCREYVLRYLHAAQDVRRKWGKRAAYRDVWLRAALVFRRHARGADHWSAL